MPRLNQNVECEQSMKVLKKLFRGKRAFSPVIASLILMLIAVAAGVVVYAYVMGWLGGATGAPGGTQGEMQFDSIKIDASDSTVTMYVRNTGSKDLTIDYIYIEGTGYVETHANVTCMPSLPVNTVQSIVVDTTGTVSYTADYSYEVRVTCTDGTTVSQSQVAVA
jgi:flagellin-like protein